MDNKRNFDALYSFAKGIQNDYAKGNKKVIIALAKVKYYWLDNESEVITQVQISLDRIPFATITIVDKEWLNADDFYVEFLTGYNSFIFKEDDKTLVIECRQPNKIGNYYRVEFAEII